MGFPEPKSFSLTNLTQPYTAHRAASLDFSPQLTPSATTIKALFLRPTIPKESATGSPAGEQRIGLFVALLVCFVCFFVQVLVLYNVKKKLNDAWTKVVEHRHLWDSSI